MVGEKKLITLALKNLTLGVLTLGAALFATDQAKADNPTIAEAFFMLGLPITATADDIEKTYEFYKSSIVGLKSDPEELIAKNWTDIDWAYRALMGSQEYFEQVIEARTEFLNSAEVPKLAREILVIENFFKARTLELDAGLYAHEKWIGLAKIVSNFENFLIAEIKTFSREDLADTPQAMAFNRLVNFKNKLVLDLFFRSANETFALDALKSSHFCFTRPETLLLALEGYLSHSPLRSFQDFLSMEKKFRILVGEDKLQNEILDQALGKMLRESTRYLEVFKSSLSTSELRALEFFSHPPGESTVKTVLSAQQGIRTANFGVCGQNLRALFP